jgi:hypothetical protein
LGLPQNPQRQVHALLAGFVQDTFAVKITSQYYQQNLLKPTQKESKFPLQIAHFVIVINV